MGPVPKRDTRLPRLIIEHKPDHGHGPAGLLLASFEGPQLSTASSPSGSPLFVVSIACWIWLFQILHNSRGTSGEARRADFWGTGGHAGNALMNADNQTNIKQRADKARAQRCCLVELASQCNGR